MVRTTLEKSLIFCFSIDQFRQRKSLTNQKNIQLSKQSQEEVHEKENNQNDQYWRGLPNEFNWFGMDVSDDQAFPKRKRKTKHDDNDDYQGAYRSSKKKNINTNKIQALLEWRDQIQDQQLKIITDFESTDPNAKIPPFFKQKTSKNIISQKLQDIAQNVQALFINIQWGKKGQTLQDFEKLKIQSTKFMSKGIAFVWTPKEFVSEILILMNKKNFFYVQNLQVINFDRQKAIRQYCPGLKRFLPSLSKQKSLTSAEQISEPEGQLKDIIKNLDGVEPNELIIQNSSEYFNESKRTLLMFRKTSNEKVELRHQRTCDVVFDMPVNPKGKCETQIKRYIYSMIETLLPEALIVQYKNKNELGFKMVQLWGDKGTERRGWINIYQQ